MREASCWTRRPTSCNRGPCAHRGSRGRGRRARSGGFFVSRRALAVALREETLAQANRLGRHLDELIVIDEFHRALQRELDRWREQHVLVLAGRTHVG